MKKAKLKVLFRIPFTIYWLALAIFEKKKLFCIAIKELDEYTGRYYYCEISLTENINIQEV